jgi:Amt family ammonium transporter
MMMMNIAAFAVALLAYYAVGFAFQFGGIAPIANLGGTAPLNGIFGHGSSGIIGLHGFFLQSHGSYDVGVMVLFLFQVVFMETAGYIIIGAIAERISFAGFLLAEVAMGAVIYPIYGMWVWGGGWLAHLGTSLHLGHGAVDFAGSGVVHATGGWTALALAMVLGPRIGKFNKDGSANAIPGHNIPYVVIGTLVLIFGWMGFNPGSTLGATDLRIGLVAVNTLLAACAGFVMAMGTTNAKYGKPDISMSCNGMLAGLVAITAPCAFVAPWAAVIIGAIAGVVVVYSVAMFDRLGIDDPCGAISVHGMCGAFGVLAVGLFADGTYGIGWNGVGATSTHGVRGLFYGDGGQLIAQGFHIVVGFAWAWGITWIIFKIAKNFMQIRVSPEVEIEGLDVPEFGVLAYPDFVLSHASSGGHAPPPGAVPSGSASNEGIPR